MLLESPNGSVRPRRSRDTVRVAVVGVGNCASALIQGVEKYRHASADELHHVPGLMHVDLGGYHVGDIDFVAAFDVDARKVGHDLGEAIFAEPNNTVQFANVPPLGVQVSRGRTLDGIGQYLSEVIQPSAEPEADVADVLRQTRADVLVNYLPVGSERATHWYMEQALAADCAVVNCIPVFIAREAVWRRRFEEHGLPIIGDDIKSQVGATIVHRMLARLFRDRGVRLERTSQLNVGGNTDFLNMLERSRLESKKISKTTSVTSQLEEELPAEDIHVGPSDYVPWLTDRKWAHIRLEGRSFGGVPLNLELKLEVWDSPNSAGVVIDAVRCAKLGLDRGLSGALEGPAAYFMKSPPVQYRDEEARQMVESFIAANARSTGSLVDHKRHVERHASLR
jgi:myo-inositol-1-phosphate synthase